jgi:glycerophosphoryl diester phosphodiesterase
VVPKKLVVLGIVAFLIMLTLSYNEGYRIGSLTEKQFVIAHRGDMKSYPEETMVAYDFAVSNGLSIVECDAQRTMDGYFVAVHDSTWDRTTNGTGSIQATNWMGYGEFLNAGGGETVPLFTDLFDFAKDEGVLLWVDCYFSGIYDGQFKGLLENESMIERVVLQFVVETGAYNRAQFYDGFTISYRVALPWHDLVSGVIDKCYDVGVVFLTIPWEVADTALFDKATKVGVRLVVFSFNHQHTDSEYLQVFQMGAWGAFVDDSMQGALITKYLSALEG